MLAVLRRKLKNRYRRAKLHFIRRFFRYDKEQLKKRLHALGVRDGDTILLHSAYSSASGFDGPPSLLVEAFIEAVGAHGNLLMVSMPYSSSTSDYLRQGRTFDVRNTPSKMGLVTEAFRRRPNVVRSVNPAHPVLAHGPRAEWIVANHENCPYSCGPGSPFEKLASLNGKVLFFGVSEYYSTFYHYLEHLIQDGLPFPLYEAEPYVTKVIDAQGGERSVTTYAFSKEAISRRRPAALREELARNGQFARSRIGNTPLLLVSVSEGIRCTQELVRKGAHFYQMG